MGGIHDELRDRPGDRLLFNGTVESFFPILRPGYRQHEICPYRPGRTGIRGDVDKHAGSVLEAPERKRVVRHLHHSHGRETYGGHAEDNRRNKESRPGVQDIACRELSPGDRRPALRLLHHYKREFPRGNPRAPQAGRKNKHAIYLLFRVISQHFHLLSTGRSDMDRAVHGGKECRRVPALGIQQLAAGAAPGLTFPYLGCR